MLRSKTAIVTGSSRGIGKSIIDLFIENNISVIWACYREKNQILEDEIINKIKDRDIIYNPIYFDFSYEEQVLEAAKKISSESSQIDILVNNAGIIDTSLFLMTKIDSIKSLFNINFFSQLIFTQIIVKKMMKNKSGSIVNISSTAASDPIRGRLAYSSSKSALQSASNIMSKEFSQFNIRVNSIAPGLTNTDLMHGSHSQDIIDDMNKKISLGRVAEPNEIANAVLFLASDLSSYVTGQTIRVDGGIL